MIDMIVILFNIQLYQLTRTSTRYVLCFRHDSIFDKRHSRYVCYAMLCYVRPSRQLQYAMNYSIRLGINNTNNSYSYHHPCRVYSTRDGMCFRNNGALAILS
jgi:hypothetical protein